MTTSTPSERNDGPLRRVWFPLRSNVPHAGRPDIGVEARAKLLALLAGELLFEPGLLDVVVTEAGAGSCWIPPGAVDEEGYRRRRLAGMRVGEPVVVAWTPEGDEVTSPLVSAHVLEYHTLLGDSGLEGLPWVRWSAPEPIVARAEESARRDERSGAAPPRSPALPRTSESPSADEQIAAGLESDISFAALMGAAAAVDDSRRQLIKRLAATARRFGGERPGSEPVSVSRFRTPDVAQLEWPEVVALRDDPAVAELRAAANRYALEQAGPRRAATGGTARRLDAALRRARGLAGAALPDAVVELAAAAPPGAGHGTAPDAPGPTAVLVLVPSPARRA